MDYMNYLLPSLLLAVVLSPLLGALLCLFTRGKVAVPFALLHLGLVIGLAMLTFGTLTERGSRLDEKMPSTANSAFVPLAVPGDPGLTSDTGNTTYTTEWTVLSFALGNENSTLPEIQFYIGIDGLNLWLIVLSSVMFLVALLISQNQIKENVGSYTAWLFVLQTAVLGAFTAFDVILFYVFFELTLIPSFFLIGRWGVGRAKRDAAKMFFLYTLFGSLFTLVGILGIVLTNPTPVNALSPTAAPFYQVNINANGDVMVPKKGPITFSIPKLMKNVSAWGWASRLQVDLGQKRLDAAETKNAEITKQLNLATPQTIENLKVEVVKATKAVTTARESLAQAQENHSQRTWYQTLLFIALVAGFAVKIPIMPFHTWLPTTYAEAPIPVTMLFSAVLAKLGTFGLVRVVLPLAPDAFITYGIPVFGTLGAIGIVYGAFCAFAQKDMKLLTAYSSISHLGFLVMAIFIANQESLSGAVLHMVNHGLSTGAMFALLGFLFARYRTLDSHQYGGLMGKFPAFAFMFILVCLASVGLPGLNNFVSEMLMLSSFFRVETAKVAGFGLAAAAASGIFLSAWYTFTMVRRVFFGPELCPPVADSAPQVLPLSFSERLGFLLPIALCVVLGVYPQPILDTIRGDVETLVQHADFARSRTQSNNLMELIEERNKLENTNAAQRPPRL